MPQVSKRSRLIACGLLVLGLLTWGGKGPLGSPLLFLPAVALVVSLIADTLRWSWFARLQERSPRLPWSRLTPIAIWGLLVIALLRSGAFFGFFVFGIGLVMLIRQSPTEVGPLDVRRTWATWGRRIMLGFLLLAALSFSTKWDGDFSSSYSYDSGDYRYTNTTRMAGLDAYETGDAPVLALLVALSFVATAWRPGSPAKWHSFAPLVPGIAAVLLALRVAIADNAEVQELYEIGGTYAKFNAEGAPWFMIFMVLFCITATISGFRQQRASRQPLEPLASP